MKRLAADIAGCSRLPQTPALCESDKFTKKEEISPFNLWGVVQVQVSEMVIAKSWGRALLCWCGLVCIRTLVYKTGWALRSKASPIPLFLIL